MDVSALTYTKTAVWELREAQDEETEEPTFQRFTFQELRTRRRVEKVDGIQLTVLYPLDFTFLRELPGCHSSGYLSNALTFIFHNS